MISEWYEKHMICYTAEAYKALKESQHGSISGHHTVKKLLETRG